MAIFSTEREGIEFLRTYNVEAINIRFLDPFLKLIGYVRSSSDHGRTQPTNGNVLSDSKFRPFRNTGR